MTIRSLLSSSFWIWPFAAFFGGYQLVRLVTHVETVKVPTVVGLHLNEAIQLLSADQLNVRILGEKEDFDLQEGTILNQTPYQGQLVKPHQSVFLVTSRRPHNSRAPKIVGETRIIAQEKARAGHLSLKIYQLESSFPKDICITQSVLPDQEVKDSHMTVYCSTGTTPFRIIPDVKTKIVAEVISFFGTYNIPVKVMGDMKGTIIEQQPLAGTLVDISKPLVIELTTKAPSEPIQDDLPNVSELQ